MIPLTTRYCPTCGRPTAHRRRLVPLSEIDPAERHRQIALDGRAVLPPECQEHGPDSPRPER